MKNRFLLITLLILLGFLPAADGQTSYVNITGYKVYYGIIARNQQNLLITRQFQNEGKNYCLLVNPRTLETEVVESKAYAIERMSFDRVRDFFKNTPYVRALNQAEEQSRHLQNAGIVTGSPRESGISLTADLCPSRRPLDKRIFTEIANQFKGQGKATPVALSVSGIWMRQHPRDLEWLKQLQADGVIAITWVNHSFNHRFNPKLPLQRNFMLQTGTDISYEVLETEKAMLKNGLLPSVFFRFPGLVSNQQLVSGITGFGLIPIGSDAWLAKGQKPRNGSLVLIHANGNEPVGVNDFIKLLQSKAGDIAKKQWRLFDLGQKIVEETGREVNQQ